jgi:predicted membrane channel-forming protein YqfA (hemolysin III family)
MGFEYTFSERVVMALITGLSNLGSIPPLYIVYKNEKTFETCIGLFTLLVSVLYHVCESLEVSFYLEQDQWHILDNIGSINCFNSLLMSLMKSGKTHDEHIYLNMTSLFLVITMQAKNPWDLFNTIFPLILFTLILFYDFVKRCVPQYNKEAMKKGCTILIIAISMFVKGLDDANDYLRIYHSLWHISIGWASFYLWQLQENKVYDYLEYYKKFLNNVLLYNI